MLKEGYCRVSNVSASSVMVVDWDQRWHWLEQFLLTGSTMAVLVMERSSFCFNAQCSFFLSEAWSSPSIQCPIGWNLGYAYQDVVVCFGS